MDYMVNKDNRLRVNGKTYVYGDDLPEVTLDQTWIDQRVVILKKDVKEKKIKTNKKVLEINKEITKDIKGDL